MEKNSLIKYYYAILVILLAYVLYLLANPAIYIGFKEFINPKYLATLQDARNYYAAFQSIITIIVSIAGLILGYFYFDNKKKIDSRNLKLNQHKYFIEKLFVELNKYDKSVLTILSYCIKDDRDLRDQRSIIEQSWDIIESMIEPTLPLLKFNDMELKSFIQLNSYVDKNELIMLVPFQYLTISELLEVKSEYLSLVKSLRFLCLSKIATENCF